MTLYSIHPHPSHHQLWKDPFPREFAPYASSPSHHFVKVGYYKMSQCFCITCLHISGLMFWSP